MLWTILLGAIALLWSVLAVRAGRGLSRIPSLADAPPLADADCPSASILFSGRDEAEKLPNALPALLAQDYPRFEVVAVNDRSCDATPQILDDFARKDSRLKVVHVSELPPGWLGKPHGLQRAYEASSGEWLIFTDADVRFAPNLLRRAVALACQKGVAYLALLGQFDVTGFWEKTIVTFMGLLLMGIEPWQMSNPRSRRFAGAGYFQMLTRSAYQTIGGHRRLAMEVMDDMKLAKLVKQNGIRCALAMAEDSVRVRWHDGLWGSIRNVEKNFFALCEYRVWLAALLVLAVLVACVLPVLALPFTTGWAQAVVGMAVVVPMGIAAAVVHRFCTMRVSPLFGVTIPLGGLIFVAMLLNSTVKTLRRGGIVWRDTFYPLDQLRKGVV